jgi:hypothetical protein
LKFLFAAWDNRYYLDGEEGCIMNTATAALCILPEAIYDDCQICVSLGVSKGARAAARRSGALRFTRKGSRVLYLGRWILAWLEDGGASNAD